MEKVNNYPLVFIHGMYGFGDGDKLNDVFPYWGMITGSLINHLNDTGYTAFAPKLGPVASAWDRSCELYAMLTGTTVDYGEAHAKKFCHSRYGRTYSKPLFEGWGSKDEDGNILKIHLLGHSFGGATMREFVQLMAKGSREEIAISGKKNVSPLFLGGKGDWICSVTALAAPHDGTTLMYALPEFIEKLRYGTYYVGNILGNLEFRKVYDFHMEQYGLTSLPQGRKYYNKMFNFKGAKAAAASKDNLFWELTLDGAQELNSGIKCQPTTYYFSFPTQGTKEDYDGYHVHDKIMNPVLYFFGSAIGHYEKNTVSDIEIDKSWFPNDGLVPVVSAKHPKNEPFIDIHEADKIKKGVWHIMDTQVSDHGTIIGGSIKYIGFNKWKTFDKFYRDHIALLDSLK